MLSFYLRFCVYAIQKWLFCGTYPLINSQPRYFYMWIHYMRVYFWSPYLSHITRSTCTEFTRVPAEVCPMITILTKIWLEKQIGNAKIYFRLWFTPLVRSTTRNRFSWESKHGDDEQLLGSVLEPIPVANFINVLLAHFSFEGLFGSFFLVTFWQKKHFCTKKRE